MKKLIFILLILTSCAKDKQELVKYQIHDYTGCSQVEIVYRVNGDLITQIANPDGWSIEYMRKEGTDIYFKVRPICPGTVKTSGFINNRLYYGAIGSDSVSAEFFDDGDRLDKLFY